MSNAQESNKDQLQLDLKAQWEAGKVHSNIKLLNHWRGADNTYKLIQDLENVQKSQYKAWRPCHNGEARLPI